MPVEKPLIRRLRVFAFDPGTTAQLETADINEVTLEIPWEDVQPGPVGEYISVEDIDRQGNLIISPVDLNHPFILSRDGLAPSDGNWQFHQQMIYALAMRTIGIFENTLNRPIHFHQPGKEYVPKLRLFPHIEEIENAWYQPEHSAIYYGHFKAHPDTPYPGMRIFTCLSQDVTIHEVTHALIYDLFPFEHQGGTLDTPAFHEGFCDLVALLQRFLLPEVIRHQIAATRGDLTGKGLMGLLANQFAEAIGKKSGLRSALGELDQNGNWKVKTPNPNDIKTILEPIPRGALLLSAMFDSFNKIYRSAITDLQRIATEGSGILPEGELHPDLVCLMADEAASIAGYILELCIRALDYLPIIELDFSDFLRALVTAHYDLDGEHNRVYPLAFIDSFRQYGFFPKNVDTLSIENLIWWSPVTDSDDAKVIQDFILSLGKENAAWGLPTNRAEQYAWLQDQARQLEEYLKKRGNERGLGAINLKKPFQVQSFRPRNHSGLKGTIRSDWVIQIIQDYTIPKSDQRMQAGTTLLVDAESGLVRYFIHKAGYHLYEHLLEVWKEIQFNLSVRQPGERNLRVYAFDPGAATRLDTARINQLNLPVPWELLKPGPVGEYLEVVDYDPPTGCFYEPIDLEHPYLMAEDGYSPSQTVPQFHQQMTYAVAQRTIRNFEHALGRLALWSPRLILDSEKKKKPREEYIGKLRLFPHALREANAFYSPQKKAVLFGYFQNSPSDGNNTHSVPNATSPTIFTCLSHDIITHEITHALLDGMHQRYNEPSNPDVLAFHEAFADLVALLQHFSLPDVLKHQVAATRGDLASQNRLGELAQEFGIAVGNHGALRSALGEVDPVTGEWQPLKPDPQAYLHEMEPHRRGALLVAAVFDAFLTLYRARVAELLRIATRGSGVLPAGSLHPDLVNRLSHEAAECAQIVLEMCIRALDYCPPVDITFGEYLRAILTADCEINPVDPENRRVAFIEAFQRHCIQPRDVRAFSLEGLVWKQASAFEDANENFMIDFIQSWTKVIPSWNLASDRQKLFYLMRGMRIKLHQYLEELLTKQPLTMINPDYPFEIHSLRPATRFDWRGKPHFQWIIVIMQSRPESLDGNLPESQEPDYIFRGGATLLVDAETGKVRYSIHKRIDSPGRRERQRKYMTEIANGSLHATYFRESQSDEPFAILHRF